jgi:purine-cytosine permease-like protein
MKLARILEWMVVHGRMLARILLVVMAALVVADFFKTPGYQRYAWDGWAGFGALYGFVSCIVIIVVSKALGYLFLYRPDDYYDDDVQRDD